jgi:drug/metabolite transporter (DMT)-like permease
MLVSVTLIWGMNFSIMKGLYSYFNPLAFTTLRFVVAVITIAVVLKLRGQPLKIERNDLPALIGLGILSNTIYQILFVIGLANTRAGNAGLLMSSTPVFAYLSGVAMKKESFHKRVLSGILISIAGVSAVILFGARAVDFHSNWFGDTLILLSAICWGLYTGAVARLILKYGALRLTLWVMVTGTAAMLPPLLPFLMRQNWHAIPVQGWLGFLYSALLAIVYG